MDTNHGKVKLRHIVLFKLKESANEKDKEIILTALNRLAESDINILEKNIEESTDQRKGLIIVENLLFKDEESFTNFKGSTLHKETGEILRQVADWWVGDYFEI